MLAAAWGKALELTIMGLSNASRPRGAPRSSLRSRVCRTHPGCVGHRARAYDHGSVEPILADAGQRARVYDQGSIERVPAGVGHRARVYDHGSIERILAGWRTGHKLAIIRGWFAIPAVWSTERLPGWRTDPHSISEFASGRNKLSLWLHPCSPNLSSPASTGIMRCQNGGAPWY